MSLFFLLGCVPVVTAGASFAALYDAVYRGFRQGEKNTWQRFLHVYRTNWKASIVPTMVFIATVYGLGYGMIQCWNVAVYGNISWMLFAGLAFVAVVLAGVLSVLFPMLSRFENPVAVLLKNTVMLALANLPRTVVLGVVNVVAALVCVLFIIPLFLVPALAALISTVCIEPMFKPYMPAEPEEEAAQ